MIAGWGDRGRVVGVELIVGTQDKARREEKKKKNPEQGKHKKSTILGGRNALEGHRSGIRAGLGRAGDERDVVTTKDN